MYMNVYPIAYKEVWEILKYIPNDDKNKIPKELLDMIEKRMDRNHVFNVDVNKGFAEQGIMEETKAVLSVFFRDYWANERQREKIRTKELLEFQVLNEYKREKYNPDNLFKKKERQENILPVEFKKRNMLAELFHKIRVFFIRGKE